MPARKQSGLILLWSSGTRWSGNQSYIAVPKSTSQITCALWPLLTRDAAKSQKGAGLAAFQAVHSEQSGNLVKKLLRVLWLKQRRARDNHPWPSHFHPTASQQQKADPEQIWGLRNAQPFLKMCNTKIRQYIEVLLPLFSRFYWYYTLLSCGLCFWGKEL